MINLGHVIAEQRNTPTLIYDKAYQSNMRSLLQRPTSVTLNGSRPNSAIFLNLDSRPTSGKLPISRFRQLLEFQTLE